MGHHSDSRLGQAQGWRASWPYPSSQLPITQRIQLTKNSHKSTFSASVPYTLCFGHNRPLAICPQLCFRKILQDEGKVRIFSRKERLGHPSQLGDTAVREHFLEETASELSSAEWIINIKKTAHNYLILCASNIISALSMFLHWILKSSLWDRYNPY